MNYYFFLHLNSNSNYDKGAGDDNLTQPYEHERLGPVEAGYPQNIKKLSI